MSQQHIYVWAFVSDEDYAESQNRDYYSRCMRSTYLPNLPGDGYTKNRGNLFKISIWFLCFQTISLRSVSLKEMMTGGKSASSLPQQKVLTSRLMGVSDANKCFDLHGATVLA